jgi:uroporphyrinogen decarboxylase
VYRAVVTAFPEEFVMTGGVVGTIYGCGQYLGQTNLFMKLIEEPELVECLAERITEQNVQNIRLLAEAGGDAIYVDDATATSEMISVGMYERFSLPYMKRMVEEIHRVSHKAVIIYFGGVMDRLAELASIGADGLAVEASMKGYVNDIGTIARRIGDRVSLFANVNPYEHIQRLPEDRLMEVMQRHAAAAAATRGFIMASGSPITMATRLSRVRWFIDYGRTLPPSRRL